MFVAEKAYICNMRRWCIKILLIAVLSLVSVFLYEVLWVLVDLDVRRDFINNGIPLDELFFDVRLCTVLTLLSLGYSYLIAKIVKRFVKSIPFRWGLFAFFVLVANTATAAASTAVLDWWLEYVSNDEIRAENFLCVRHRRVVHYVDIRLCYPRQGCVYCGKPSQGSGDKYT